MDWTVLVEFLGGGPAGVMVAGLGFLFWKERTKNEALTSLLMDRKDDLIREGERREIITHQMLVTVTDLIKEYARSK